MSNINAQFYDIESLSNVFSLCNYKPLENSSDIYYLCDDAHWMPNQQELQDILLTEIKNANKKYKGSIRLFDLHEEASVLHLIKTFGLSDATNANRPKETSSYPSEFRLTCDTDFEYDPNIHPYFMGYNSDNYDTTMLSFFEYETMRPKQLLDEHDQLYTAIEFQPTTAKLMRSYNDDLFLGCFIDNMPKRLAQDYDHQKHTWKQENYQSSTWRIRKNMIRSGRHIDVARLNEKLARVALKRLLGMLGYQILESDKLKNGSDFIENLEQFAALIAYNMSDCMGLEFLFHHKLYQSQFALKKALLQKYPELIYDEYLNTYKPDITPNKVSRDRLIITSSSAQFATRSLCPYGHLKDIPAVSYLYPSEEKAKELGIPRVNVLEETKKFFYNLFQQPEIRTQFDVIYNFYKNIEGKNFNNSESYENDYLNDPAYKVPYNFNAIPKENLCMCYFNQDGSPSSCYVIFSTGGIHGAEYNKALYDYDKPEYQKKLDLMNKVKELYPIPTDLVKAKKVIIDEVSYPASKFVKAKATEKYAVYKDIKEPLLFVKKDKGYKLNDAYKFTSADLTNHEDFTSYYPNMLRMLMAFYNRMLKYDRYAEIFFEKEKYGKEMKDQAKSKSERALISDLREGTKLILNSASGAGDTNYESNIRMNNNIISMRIIGQLFSWRIGQSQTVHGARVTSTNTDGLFSVLDAELNAIVLKQESENINVEIEPEPTFLISKDSNNRLEMDADSGKIENVSGGTLSCALKGPNPTKSLDHPAILDWALAEYLIYVSLPNGKNLTLYDYMDETIGRNILKSAIHKFDKIEFLRMMQMIVSSSPSSTTYVFGSQPDNPNAIHFMQHYNRVFFLKDHTPNTVHLRSATAKKITDAMIKTRTKANERLQQHDPFAVKVLSGYKVDLASIPQEKEMVLKKITNIEPNWFIYIQNRALDELSEEELTFIIEHLDYEKYLKLLCGKFDKNWRNKRPGEPKRKKAITEEETDDDSESDSDE